MPRVTPLRVLKLLLLPWITLVGLWMFLPSPTIRPAFRDHHVQTILSSGQTLTTVHEWHQSYAKKDRNGRVRSRPDDCSGLIIDWRLIARDDTDSVSLQIGTALTVNLTEAILHRKNDTDEKEGPSPYFGSTLDSEVRLGDQDHVINMPWFAWPDQTLFHYDMHTFTYPIALMLVVPKPGTVEVWKDTPRWRIYSDDRRTLGGDRDSGLLASFSNLSTLRGARASITRIKVSEVKGKLPSKTYPIRRLLLVPLAPVLSIGGFIVLSFIIPLLIPLIPLLPVYVVVVLLVWLYKGRPNFYEWTATFWMTRWIVGGKRPRPDRRARIWGPAGPVSEEEYEYGYGKNTHGVDKKDTRWASARLSEESGSRFWSSKKSRASGGRFQLPR